MSTSRRGRAVLVLIAFHAGSEPTIDRGAAGMSVRTAGLDNTTDRDDATASGRQPAARPKDSSHHHDSVEPAATTGTRARSSAGASES